MPNPHDTLIAGAAKAMLGPLGFVRKGRSRVWFADFGWWLNLVEFQPSGWAKGCYLNVAVHWLWTDQEHLSFDYGGRIEPFVEYASDPQFEQEAERLAQSAAKEVLGLMQMFPTTEAVATILVDVESQKPDQARGSWTAYHAGMALGLSGRGEEASAMFRSVRDDRVQPAVDRMNKLLSDPKEFRRESDELIAGHRKQLGLTPSPGSPPPAGRPRSSAG